MYCIVPCIVLNLLREPKNLAMKINFKYLIPIMVLACLNVALLNDFFETNIYSNTSISTQPIAKVKPSNEAKSKWHTRDSIETKEVKVY